MPTVEHIPDATDQATLLKPFGNFGEFWTAKYGSDCPQCDCADADTGEPVWWVFSYDPATQRLGRYKADADGDLVLEEKILGRPVLIEIWEARRLQVPDYSA